MTPIGAIYNKKVLRGRGRRRRRRRPGTSCSPTCDKIKKAGKIPIALGNQTPWVTQLIPYAIAPSTAFADDPNLAQDMLDGKKSFSNSGGDEVYKRYVELEQARLLQPQPERHDVRAADGDGGQRQGGDGDPGHGRRCPAILDAAKNKADIGTFPFPAADNADDLKIAAGVSAGPRRERQGKHMDAAKTFIDWLGAARADGESSPTAATRSRWSSTGRRSSTRLVKPFASFVKEGKTVPFMDQQWPNAKVQPVHFAGVQELFAGKTDIDGLLPSIDEAYQQK